jgi:hypothetical protein
MGEGEDRLGTRSNIRCGLGPAGRSEGEPILTAELVEPKIGPPLKKVSERRE